VDPPLAAVIIDKAIMQQNRVKSLHHNGDPLEQKYGHTYIIIIIIIITGLPVSAANLQNSFSANLTSAPSLTIFQQRLVSPFPTLLP